MSRQGGQGGPTLSLQSSILRPQTRRGERVNEVTLCELQGILKFKFSQNHKLFDKTILLFCLEKTEAKYVVLFYEEILREENHAGLGCCLP